LEKAAEIKEINMVITPLIAALLIGSFWTGVATTAVLDHNGMDTRSNVVVSATVGDDAHIAACHARYRSYEEETDMYMGFDGSWHVCTLGAGSSDGAVVVSDY
jgi:hypothetical protein